jgi:hypothetical protein
MYRIYTTVSGKENSEFSQGRIKNKAVLAKSNMNITKNVLKVPTLAISGSSIMLRPRMTKVQ